MRHNVFGQQLGRDSGQRQALLKGLAGAIVRSERIETTEAKAEAARGLIEKMITQAKRGTVNDIRQIEGILVSKELIEKLVKDIAPRFQNRAGGYLRLTKIGTRSGDNAQMVRMEFVTGKQAVAPATVETPKAHSAEPKTEAKVTTSAKKAPVAKKTSSKAAPKSSKK